MTDERARIVAELRWLADARQEYVTDTFPQIEQEVRTARHLADILERKTPVADGGQGFGWLPSWRWGEWDQMALRRPVQAEPTDAQVEAALCAAIDATEHRDDGITFTAMRAALKAAFTTNQDEIR
ncbi:hypothetical protein PTQ19_07080 [Microbacterium esteraromaticum]|uniref:hypothetical protein n=1 Tax=Microbacterium esteraromaticum TaxID=57043 RepID=UPI0023674923|nr:hypothetical protein [Microbacterium esteraromaticum]WDH80186.1 hypothetical protein PTQ19_07080 [Microbacterium esteraromaticum]